MRQQSGQRLWTRRKALRAIGALATTPLFASAFACGTSEVPSEATASASTQPSGAASVGSRDKPTNFFCYMETLTADRPSIYGYLAQVGCQPSGAFGRGERMVFRFMVFDPTSAQYVTPEQAASIRLRLPFVGDEAADYKQRGEGRVADAPWTWDYCWDVPLDYPLGTLDYSVLIALKDGRSGEWKPPALVDPSRGIDTRPQIREQST